MVHSHAFDLDLAEPRPGGRAPGSPVRMAINQHAETHGRHRFRLRFDREIVDILARGLENPRIHLSGTTVNGFRVWCSDRGGYAPVRSKYTGGWDFTMPIRRVRGREEGVPITGVDFEWERDETGPVLVIPRIPDPFLPAAVIESLPNRAVDPQTIQERVDRKLKRAFRVLSAEPEPEPAPPAVEPEPVAQSRSATLTLPERAAPWLIPLDGDPVPPDVTDLKAAMGLVNELVDRLGDNIVLYVDPDGRCQAKRRVVSFIEL
jgi:hypothetical protein